MARGGGGRGGPTLYYEIADFKQGMDLRKSALTAPAGTMRLLQNAHITPGGEIEKRSAFNYWVDAPAGSLGLSAANGQPYTHLVSHALTASVSFGPVVSQAVTCTVANPGVFTDPGNLTDGTEIFLTTAGKLPSPFVENTPYFVVNANVTGGTYSLDNTAGGTGIKTTDAGTGTMLRIQSGQPVVVNDNLPVGASVSFSGAIPGGMTQGSTYLVASAGHTSSSYQITDPQGNEIDYETGQPTGACTRTTSIITPPTPSAPGVVELSPPASGATLVRQVSFDVYNGLIYAVFLGSDGAYYHYYNGMAVTLPPAVAGSCTYCRTYKEKMYTLSGRYLYFSAVGDPTTWQDPPPDREGNVAHNGSGFINIGANDADSDNLISMEVYYDKMAIFSLLSCQLWFLDPDPSLNQYYQTLRDAGTVAVRSARQYVANDVYFLGTHGIRSLRARDLSLTAAVADVGSPLDPLIQSLFGAGPDMTRMIALLSPRSGRIWMVLADRIYILSNFASPNISAWSVYLPDGWTVDDAVYADPYVVLRDTAGHLYRFGSAGPLVYDSCPVTVTLPWLSFDKPTTFKWYEGFDAICTNAWNVQASLDPALDGASSQPWDQWCVLNGPTTLLGRIPVQSRSTHVQMQITCAASGPATFSKLFVHYSPGDTD